MDAFMDALLSGSNVKASARVKTPDGVKTVTLKHVPGDVSEESFLHTANLGVSLKLVVKKDDDRSRTYSNSDVRGAAATSATANVLGYVPADDTDDDTPEPSRRSRRGRKTEPSANGTPEPVAN